MAATDNSVSVVGNMTRDPELRFTTNGAAVCNFSIAVNRRWWSKAMNDWEEDTSFFDVTAWAAIAENVAESLERGDRVIVVGRMDQRTWENDQGEKRSKVEIVADDVGPSLRWATVGELHKPERGGGDRGTSQGGGGGYTSDPF